MIPRIVHQTWKSRDLPDRYRRWSNTFERHLHGWEYRFWDDTACLDLVRRAFPDRIDAYLGLTNPAERADLFRYMVLHEHGGLYADIDCECRRPLDFLEDTDEFVVATELDTASARVMELYRSDMPKLYCQWAFLSRPRHPILGRLIEEIARSRETDFGDDPIVRVLKRTGPHAFTRSVLAHLAADAGPVRILPASSFGASDSANVARFAFSFLFPEFGRKVYIRHRFEMSWMDRKAKRDMILRNLFPFRSRPGPHSRSDSGTGPGPDR